MRATETHPPTPNRCWYARGHSRLIISKIARHVWLEGFPQKSQPVMKSSCFYVLHWWEVSARRWRGQVCHSVSTHSLHYGPVRGLHQVRVG